MDHEQIERVRRICLALPEASERLSHGEPTFFVGKKVFVSCAINHHGDGRMAVWLPVPPGFQGEMIESAPEVYFKPPYVGVRGWVGIVLERIGENDLQFHIHTAWELIAPKRLVAQIRANSDTSKPARKPIQSIKFADDAPYVVQYHAYDPRLPQVFAKIKSLIQSAAGPIRVEHIGSSSIPGVGGRNVLDIAVPAAEAQHAEIRRALYELGFEDAPFPHYLPLLVGQIAHASSSYTILLYLVPPESSVFAEWIEFRDYMRDHAEDARAYDATKREVIAQGSVEGDDYQNAKNPFLAAVSAKLRGQRRR